MKMGTSKVTGLFNIEKPIIQAGMIWVSGWRLASAVSNAGGLGIIGSGSMYPDVLKEHIKNVNRPQENLLRLTYPYYIPILTSILVQ